MEKTFIQVTAEHDADGRIRPISLRWENGQVYNIDRVMDVRMAAALKVGGQGIRYTCRIQGKMVYLFCDEGRWFIEK